MKFFFCSIFIFLTPHYLPPSPHPVPFRFFPLIHCLWNTWTLQPICPNRNWKYRRHRCCVIRSWVWAAVVNTTCALLRNTEKPSHLSHPHSKKVFPDVQRKPPVLLFVPIVSGPVTGHRWEEPGSVLFAPSLQVLIRSSLNLLFLNNENLKQLKWEDDWLQKKEQNKCLFCYWTDWHVHSYDKGGQGTKGLSFSSHCPWMFWWISHSIAVIHPGRKLQRRDISCLPFFPALGTSSQYALSGLTEVCSLYAPCWGQW